MMSIVFQLHETAFLVYLYFSIKDLVSLAKGSESLICVFV
jgi:hypothetical protein